MNNGRRIKYLTKPEIIMFHRWDIINHFIKKNDYKNYLEIGYYKGWSFDQINCEYKTAVDPSPSKTPYHESMKHGNIFFSEGHINPIYKVTSDEFFSGKVVIENDEWDIIFIDGLHESEQVYKDIMNSLDHLSEGGTIILHDCNPPLYEHTTTGIDGCWTGDTYKAFIRFKDRYPEYESYCVDTDWGCGVIKTPPVIGFFIDDGLSPNDWEYFNEHRKSLLDLITVQEFLEREK